MAGLSALSDKRYRPSGNSVVVSARLPHDLNEILERRAANHTEGLSGYIRERLSYDLKRNHHRRKA